MKIFAASSMQQKKKSSSTVIKTGVHCILARDEAEAADIAILQARKEFPLASGWYNHQVIVKEVPTEWINES